MKSLLKYYKGCARGHKAFKKMNLLKPILLGLFTEKHADQ